MTMSCYQVNKHLQANIWNSSSSSQQLPTNSVVIEILPEREDTEGDQET